MRTGSWLAGNFRTLVISCTVSSLVLLTAVVFSRMGMADGEAHPSAWMVRGFSHLDVQAALRSAGNGDEIAYADGRRTSDADGLIIYGETATDSKPMAWIVRAGTVRRVDRHAGHSYVNEDGKPSVWWDTEGIHFPHRPILSLAPDTSFVAVDVSGTFLSILRTAGSTSVRRVESPDNEVWGCTNFYGYDIRLAGTKLFLFGHEPLPRLNPSCIVLVEDGGLFKVERRIELSDGEILDVDPTGEALLVRERFDISGVLYIYNINSRRMSKCKTIGIDDPAFLRRDPFARPLVPRTEPKKLRSARSLRLFLEGIVYKDLVAGESTNKNCGLLCLGTDQNQTYLTSLFTNVVPRIEPGTNNIVIGEYGLSDRITGRPAKFFWADLESLTNNIATIDAGSDTGRRGFVSYSYQLRAKGTNWVIVKRRVVAIS